MSEKSILSAMIQEPADFVRRALGEGLKADMFHVHSRLFEAIVAENKLRGGIDLTVFIQALALEGTLESLGGAATISEIYNYSPVPGGRWTDHVTHLRETYALRLAANRAERLSEVSESSEAIQCAEDALKALRDAVRGPKRAIGAREAVNDFAERIRAAHEAGELPGASTGIPELDAVSGGMRPGEFWVTGGRPSQGKSALMLQIASAFILRSESVAIFSLEMMTHEIVGRLVANIGRVNYGAITQPRTAVNGDLQGIRNASLRLVETSFWLDDGAGQTVESIRNEAIRLRDACGGKIGLVVVDYLQLIRGGRNRNESREEEVARVSGSLKQLAKELACPVISATQLNEQGQSRESRAIEQDADALLYICNDGIKIHKLRNGRRDDTLPLCLDGAHQRFVFVRPQDPPEKQTRRR